MQKEEARLRIGEQFHIAHEHMHPLSGARLRLLERARSPRKSLLTASIRGRFIVGWFAGGAQSTRYYHRYTSASAAKTRFANAAQRTPPQKPEFRRDYQESALIAFDNIIRRTERLSYIRATQIVGRLNDIFNIPGSVDLKFPRHKKLSYDISDRHINYLLGDYLEDPPKSLIRLFKMPSTDAPFGQNMTTLIHEYAHHIDATININSDMSPETNWVHHGPSFVRTYLALLDYVGIIDCETSFRMAAERNIDIALLNTLPQLEPFAEDVVALSYDPDNFEYLAM